MIGLILALSIIEFLMNFWLMIYFLAFFIYLGAKLKRNFLIRFLTNVDYDEKLIASRHRYFSLKKVKIRLWIELSFYFYFL